MSEWVSNYWWVIVAGIPTLGVGSWLIGKLFGRKPGKGQGLVTGLATEQDVEDARIVLEEEHDRREKEREAARRAALAEWDDFMRRRKEEARKAG